MLGATSGDDACCTTLMIRNLPHRFTAWDLIAELECYMPRQTVDYVYVPWDKKGADNIGYGFMNFVHPTFAAKAKAWMHGAAWRTGIRIRPLKVQAAHVQGLVENVARFREQSEAVDPKHAPLVFADGNLASIEDVFARQPFRRDLSCGSSVSTASCGEEGIVRVSRSSVASASGELPLLMPEWYSEAEDDGHLCPCPRGGDWAQAGGVLAFSAAPPGLEDVPQRATLLEGAVGWAIHGVKPPPGLELGASPQAWATMADVDWPATIGHVPPPGLEHESHDDVRASPGYMRCREEVSGLLRDLLRAGGPSPGTVVV
mmetsp:Transcript_45061/g.130115  ORF Transcript_45061/g.130115 Transcript_45061/m.130115 type:complete len:316 (+) Transcript_45061:77-1024(+)